MDENFAKKVLEKQTLGAIEKYKLEKKLVETHGPEAVKIYLLIDGKLTAEEVMKQTGFDEKRFLEIISYMEGAGMLKTEKPIAYMQPPTPPAKPGKETPPTASSKARQEMPPIPLIKTDEASVKTEKEAALEALIPKGPEAQKQVGAAAPKPAEKLVGMAALEALMQGEKLPESVTGKKPAAKEPPKPARLPKTPMEKKLYDKFGDAGLYAYSLIDEFKTPRDILRETNMSEGQLKEILEFMKSEGIITLEKPDEAMEKPIMKAPSPVQQPQQAAQSRPEKPAEVKPIQKPVGRIAPTPQAVFNKNEICIPTAVNLKLITKLKLEADLLKMYGNEGVKVFSLLNGKRTNIKIIKDTKIKPAKLDDMLSFLLEKGFVKLQYLTPENVREIYGDEGYSIYTKYGRDGILLYELIDKKVTLKDIVSMSGIDPRIAVDMFCFIHKVLGLEVPLDKNLLCNQLGIKP